MSARAADDRLLRRVTDRPAARPGDSPAAPDGRPDCDVAVVGSGFGGAVTAMRLAEKGYRVVVVETGRRLEDRDFPETNRRIRRYLWAPRLGCRGPQAIRLLPGLMVLHGVGVGGGSLIYASTLMEPADATLRDRAWPPGPDWPAELRPALARAARMLGRATVPARGPGDEQLRRLAAGLGPEAAASWAPTAVGINFAPPEAPAIDPYFGGEGPLRKGCTLCGGCMIGCRVGAKNTLPKNYLWFAERRGARILAGTKVTGLTPATFGAANDHGYRLGLKAAVPGGVTGFLTARRVVLAGGVLGTIELLLRARDVDRTLPDLSPLLGRQVRTNGESLVGATARDDRTDYSHGTAIGSMFRADPGTTIQAVRYPAGSDVMGLLGVPLTGPGNRLTRPLRLIWDGCRDFGSIGRRFLSIGAWARRSVILLVMRTADEQMRLTLKRNILLPWTYRLAAAGPRLDCHIPQAQTAAKNLATGMTGDAQNIITEVLLGRTATAHLLGGACLSTGPETGVVGPDHQVHGYPGLFVCDASVIPVNLGVNPSLTVAALAERFASLWPDRMGDPMAGADSAGTPP